VRADQLLDISLAYDADDERVRADVADWLRGVSAFAEGLARALMRRDRRHVYPGTRIQA
jgi:hypothetical protein